MKLIFFPLTIVYRNMKITFILLIIAVAISIAQSNVTMPRSNSSVQTNQSNESESVIKREQRKDYYKEGISSQRYTKNVKNIRSVENWIGLAGLAMSLIVLLILLIIIIHIKAKRKSNLMYLYA